MLNKEICRKWGFMRVGKIEICSTLEQVLYILNEEFANIECKFKGKVDRIIASSLLGKHLLNHTKGEHELWAASIKVDKDLNSGYFVLESNVK